jgi:hypothetical protein
VIVWTGGAAGVDEIFSDEEIKRLRSWPGELGRNELIRYFTLGSDDRDWLSRAARGVGNRLGLAVQMCTLPWLGFVPGRRRRRACRSGESAGCAARKAATTFFVGELDHRNG